MEQVTQTLLPIRVVGELPTVESLIIADSLGVRHKNLLNTIREHQEAIEADFGIIAFETRKLPGTSKVGRPITVAHLTEDQALFVGALSRNSKQVVDFKRVLVKSFAQTRQSLPPTALSTEQALVELINQSHQLLADQSELMVQLRTDLNTVMDEVKTNRMPLAPHRRRSHQLQVPGTPLPVVSLRQLINQRVSEYSEYWQCEPRETWTYLYRLLAEDYGFNVHRIKRIEKESMLDSIERYGRLQTLYELVLTELTYT